jgi:predicted transposase YdaD
VHPLQLLQAIQAGQQGRILLPWIVVMEADDIDEAIRLWLELWTSENDDRMKSEYVALTQVFLELSKHRDRWHKALEGLDVKKSAFLEEVRTEGRQEGRQEGRREGLYEGQARSIVQFLRSKFGVALPADLVDAIEQTRDPVHLDQWINIAATVATLDEFRRGCGI